VRLLASEIVAGRWVLTHQGIAFGSDGTLYDGQHRLRAVVESGIAVAMRVTRGVSPEALDVIDTGTARRSQDVLAISDGVRIGSVLRTALVAAYHMATCGGIDVSGKRGLTVHDLRAAYNEHYADVSAVHAAFSRAHGRLTKGAMMGALAIIHRTMPSQVIEFAEMVRTGESMAADHPAASLRNFILINYVATGSTSMDDLALRTFAAFDAFAHGRPMKQLKRSESARAKYLAPWRRDDSAAT
jgi:hypothetical protein